MSPRIEREAAQDDVGAWASSPEYAEQFGRTHIPDMRAPVRVVSPLHATRMDVLTPLQALETLVQECELTLDYRPSFRRAMSDAYTTIANVPAKPALMANVWLDLPAPCFSMVSCSSCGGDFGPGDSGFSHCINHKHLRRVE